jgi:tungstate transport system permease protein
MLGLIISALSGVDKMVTETALSLGATRVQAAIVSIREVKYAIVTSLIMGFGRAISEIGIALIVGGNIAGYTRTITTAISLETQRGNLELAIALGIILVFIALIINIALHWLQRR